MALAPQLYGPTAQSNLSAHNRHNKGHNRRRRSHIRKCFWILGGTCVFLMFMSMLSVFRVVLVGDNEGSGSSVPPHVSVASRLHNALRGGESSNISGDKMGPRSDLMDTEGSGRTISTGTDAKTDSSAQSTSSDRQKVDRFDEDSWDTISQKTSTTQKHTTENKGAIKDATNSGTHPDVSDASKKAELIGKTDVDNDKPHGRNGMDNAKDKTTEETERLKSEAKSDLHSQSYTTSSSTANSEEDDTSRHSSHGDEDDGTNRDDDSADQDNSTTDDNTQKLYNAHATATAQSLYERLLKVSSKYADRSVGHLPKLEADLNKLGAVRQSFLHAWNGYKAYAFGADVLQPISQHGDNTFLGMGITILDSLDTMVIMGLKDEFWRAAQWVTKHTKFEDQRSVSVFESTIRVLGGLLSAYDMSDQTVLNSIPTFTGSTKPTFDYTKKSGSKVSMPLTDGIVNEDNQARIRQSMVKLIDQFIQALNVAFKTPTGIPHATVNIVSNTAFSPSWAHSSSSVSEFGTLQLEWQHAARLLKDPSPAEKVRNVIKYLRNMEPANSIYPVFVHPLTGKFTSTTITLGARGDSLYEYLLKSWVSVGGLEWRRQQVWGKNFDVKELKDSESDGHIEKDTGLDKDKSQSDSSTSAEERKINGDHSYYSMLREMYERSVKGIKSKMISKTTGTRDQKPLTYIAELHGERFVRKMDHLVCFAAGMLALGAPSAWGLSIEEVRNAHRKLKQSAFQSTADRLHFEDLDDLLLADELTETCNTMYTMTATGLAPEICRFEDDNSKMIVDAGSKHCLLRPETVESLFVMYRITGDKKYREYGWNIFQQIEKHAKISTGGYSSIVDVTQNPPNYRNHQESFLLAETFKYLYLLFSDSSLIPLDKFVFNTEAHPFPIESL